MSKSHHQVSRHANISMYAFNNAPMEAVPPRSTSSMNAHYLRMISLQAHTSITSHSNSPQGLTAIKAHTPTSPGRSKPTSKEVWAEIFNKVPRLSYSEMPQRPLSCPQQSSHKQKPLTINTLARFFCLPFLSRSPCFCSPSQSYSRQEPKGSGAFSYLA